MSATPIPAASLPVAALLLLLAGPAEGERPDGPESSAGPGSPPTWHLQEGRQSGGAQELQEAGERVLRGQVLRLDTPVDSGTVVLHRVTPVEAGPVDSVGVADGGGFTLILPTPPAGEGRDEVYFASTRYHGVLYYGPPIVRAAQLDSTYRIDTFPADQADAGGVPLPVSVRNLVLEESGDGWVATDIFQVRNGQERTYLPDSGGGIVWQHPLPAGAYDFQVGQGELPTDAARFVDGTVQVSAPIAPGERVYVFRYRIPELEGEIPLAVPTDVMELLIREPVGEVHVSGLASLPSEELEPGVSYRRFAGEDLAPGRIVLESGTGSAAIPLEWVAVLLALALTGVGIWAVAGPSAASRTARRGVDATAGAPGRPRSPGDGSESPAASASGPRGSREAILREIAALDEEAEAGGESNSDAYRRKRRVLLERLRTMR